MALAEGDVVSPHRVSTEFTRGYQAQPVHFGIVDNIGEGRHNVLWDTGLLQTLIADTAVDEIVAPTSYAALGKVVEWDINPTATFSPSGAYDATVVALYRRDLETSGTYTGDLALVKLLNADIYLEVEVGSIAVLNDR